MLSLKPVSMRSLQALRVRLLRGSRRHRLACAASRAPTADELVGVSEPAAWRLAEQVLTLPVTLADGRVLPTAAAWNAAPPEPSQPLLVLLAGFDSSLLEWRRLLGLLPVPACALDPLGTGLTGVFDAADASNSPAERRAHAGAFLDQHGHGAASVVLVGASLGGAAALELAAARPDRVSAVVLLAPQVYERAPAPPPFLAPFGADILRSVWLRERAAGLAYADPALATDEAMRLGRLHCLRTGWKEALIAFMATGGFRADESLAAVRCPVLVVVGSADRIVSPASASRLVGALADARLVVLDRCGHVPHLEKPQETAGAIAAFLRETGLAAVAKRSGD